MAYKAVESLLRLRLSEAGLRQKDIVRELELSRSQVSDYVRGREILPLEYAYTIAKMAGITVESLYRWEHVPPSEIKRRQRRNNE